jgi:hypothetical protein
MGTRGDFDCESFTGTNSDDKRQIVFQFRFSVFLFFRFSVLFVKEIELGRMNDKSEGLPGFDGELADFSLFENREQWE